MKSRLPFLAALVALALVGCYEGKVNYLDASEAPTDVVADDAATDVAPEDIPAPPDTGEGEPFVGAPCESDDDCPAEACVPADGLTSIGLDVDLPGGMCTELFCTADSDCGAQAACGRMGVVSLCLPACTSYADCRYAQGYSCAPMGGDELACAPNSLLVFATCGDGVCDESEKALADQCPDDCTEPLGDPTAGAPCTGNADCGGMTGGTCLTSQVLAGLLGAPAEETQVPGGMCWKMSCTEDSECGEGGACVDGSALAGVPLQLCVHACTTDADCRYGEGYACFAAGGDPPQKACLPSNLIASIRCADGVCDASEMADPALCPEDCE